MQNYNIQKHGTFTEQNHFPLGVSAWIIRDTLKTAGFCTMETVVLSVENRSLNIKKLSVLSKLVQKDIWTMWIGFILCMEILPADMQIGFCGMEAGGL